MSEEKKVNLNDNLENVNGGYASGSGFFMTVGNCSIRDIRFLPMAKPETAQA